MKKIQVGNLPDSATDDDLQVLFSQFGEVASTKVIPIRGIGYVEMPDEFADRAIEGLDGHPFRAAEIAVSPVSKGFALGTVFGSIAKWAKRR